MICALHKYWLLSLLLLLLLLLLLFSSVIPNGEGLLAHKHFFDQRTGKEPSYETLLRLAELAPALNFFQFGDQYFRRFYRTPIFQSIRLGPEPELYGRYKDDCIGASSSNREELTQFIAAANSFHFALKHTWKSSVYSLSL